MKRQFHRYETIVPSLWNKCPIWIFTEVNLKSRQGFHNKNRPEDCAHVVCAVFRRTVYPLYNQPQSGLHNRYPPPVQPSSGLRLCGGGYPPEDSAHCVRSAFPVGYFCGIPDGIFSSLLHK